MSEVREAVVTSVTKRPVRRSRNQASVVPSRRDGRWPTSPSSQASFEAEKYGSSGRPARSRVTPSAPLARRRSNSLAGTTVLPDDHRRQRLAGGPVPGEAALALIVEAHGGRRPGGVGTGADVGQQLQRIMLDPAGTRVVLPMADGVADLGHAAFDDQQARAGRPLVDGGDAHRPPASASPRAAVSPTARSAARISACRLAIMSPIGGPWNRRRSNPNQMTSSKMKSPIA